MYQHPHDVRPENVRRDVVRSTLAVAVAGAGFLLLAAVWVSTCGGSVADPLACGVPQRTLLSLGAPAIFLTGAARAFLRTLQHRRRSDAWVAWQSAGWFLMALTVLVVTTSTPALVGSVVLP
ncbi:hypothetical protein ACN27E_11375 [Mycobacterium sp. WMMD1722]|uniref:hypothetical protein n=1 Tax=Mycobacterium sp. WMMD1722 TaxID=3404117 RepID=UPI003BF59A87